MSSSRVNRTSRAGEQALASNIDHSDLPGDERHHLLHSPRPVQGAPDPEVYSSDPSCFLEVPTQGTLALPSPPDAAELAGASYQATLVADTAGTHLRMALPQGSPPTSFTDAVPRQLPRQGPRSSPERPSYREWHASARAGCCYVFSRSL